MGPGAERLRRLRPVRLVDGLPNGPRRWDGSLPLGKRWSRACGLVLGGRERRPLLRERGERRLCGAEGVLRRPERVAQGTGPALGHRALHGEGIVQGITHGSLGLEVGPLARFPPRQAWRVIQPVRTLRALWEWSLGVRRGVQRAADL